MEKKGRPPGVEGIHVEMVMAAGEMGGKERNICTATLSNKCSIKQFADGFSKEHSVV